MISAHIDKWWHVAVLAHHQVQRLEEVGLSITAVVYECSCGKRWSRWVWS